MHPGKGEGCQAAIAGCQPDLLALDANIVPATVAYVDANDVNDACRWPIAVMEAHDQGRYDF